MHAKYNAAAAIPIGSFPATIPIFFASSSMEIALRLLFSLSSAILAILETPFTGSTTWHLKFEFSKN